MGIIEQLIPKDEKKGLIDSLIPGEQRGGLIDSLIPFDDRGYGGASVSFDGQDVPRQGDTWWEQLIYAGYRPIGAYLKSSVESLQAGSRPSLDPLFAQRYAERLFGPIEDISGKAVTEPVVQAVIKGLPDNAGTLLGVTYYGGFMTGRDPERLSVAYLKTVAEQGKLGDLRADDFPAQMSPAGTVNFLIESLGLDWFIPAGVVARPLGSAARALSSSLFKAAPFTERIAGAFSRHLGPGAPVNKLADEFYKKLTFKKGKVGFGEARVRKDLIEVLDEFNIDVKKADPLFDDIAETFKPVKDVYETPQAFFTGDLATKALPPAPRSLSMVVKQTFPEITDPAKVDKVAKAIEHYIHIGKEGIEAERAVGIPIKALGGDKNYMLHYLTDEAREVGPALRRTAAALSGKEEARLTKDLFHPSLLKRQFDMTIREGNDLAAAGRVYISAGKIGIAAEGKKLPVGAKKISKLFETDPLRLGVIRQLRTARAVTTKEYLDEAIEVIPDYDGPGAVTMESLLGKKKWAETFGLMGDAAGKYKTKFMEPQVAKTLMHGLQRMHDFKLGKKPVALDLYDKTLNFWKPLQLYFYPKYHTRNLGTAQWNEFLNDNLFGMAQGHAEFFGTAKLRQETIRGIKIPTYRPSLADHPMFEEMVEWGVLGRSQFTADIEKGIAFGNTKWGVHKAGEWMENFIRGSAYIGWRRKGLPPRLAARKVMESQFDYLDLTAWEWNVMRRVFPFYTFSRKNIPFQISRLIENPYKGTAPLRGALATELPWDPGEEDILPSSVKGRFPVKVGKNTYLALEDSWAMFDIRKINPVGGKLIEELTQMIGPHLKATIEDYSRTVDGRWTGWGPFGQGEPTGYSLFSGRPIAPWWKERDTVWGVQMPVKVANRLKNTFRFFNEVEKSPWYPEDEDKPLGQSSFARSLQFWGVPYYESHPQQQIYFAIRELQAEQEEMGGLKPSTGERYKDAAFKVIALRGKQNQMLEPFRGGKRIIHRDDAILDELSKMTGVDMKAIRTKHGSKWRDVAMYTPNVFVDFAEIRREFKRGEGETSADFETRIRKTAFDVLEREAKATAFFRGGVENISDTIGQVTTLLHADETGEAFRGINLLTGPERTWLRGTLISTLMAGVEYLDENRRSGGSEWYDYADQAKTWAGMITARTGQTPKQIQDTYQATVKADYDKVMGESILKPSTEAYEDAATLAKRLTTDPYLSAEHHDYWWAQWASQKKALYNYAWSKKDIKYISGGSQLAGLIKDDSIPLEIRREFARYYAEKVDGLIKAGIKTKTAWGWVEDNIAPLFQSRNKEV